MKRLILCLSILFIMAYTAWGDKKEWKEEQQNNNPPVIANEDTVLVENCERPKQGRLRIDKLRGTQKKNVLLLGEVLVCAPTNKPLMVPVMLGDSLYFEASEEMQVEYSYAVSVHYIKDTAVVTWKDGRGAITYSADVIALFPTVEGE